MIIRIAGCCLLLAVLISTTTEKKGKLPKELKEISGWIFVNDSTLIAHNDSGNDPVLFVLNLDGSIRHKARIKGVDNVDFEDITSDGKGTLYVGDIGNNDNLRKNLVIYRVKTAAVLQHDEVDAKAIHFSYPEQEAFPPAATDRNYDAEALTFYDDSLFIFTKCRTEPFDGKCFIYSVPVKAGVHKAKRLTYIKTGKRGIYQDAVTGADLYRNELHLLTYNRVLIYTFKDKIPLFKNQISMQPLSQKEAIAVRKNGKVYVADEVQKIVGGGNVYVVSQPTAKGSSGANPKKEKK